MRAAVVAAAHVADGGPGDGSVVPVAPAAVGAAAVAAVASAGGHEDGTAGVVVAAGEWQRGSCFRPAADYAAGD